MRRLLTIPISHFCEKARWSLDRAGLGYVEERHVQGVHRVVARRAGGGKTLPVLVEGDTVLRESEEIVCYADAQLPPERRLVPEDAAERDEILTLSRHLDEGLGPDGRRWVYAQMLELKPLLLKYNNQGVPRWEDWTMRAFFPIVTRLVRRELHIVPTTIGDDEPRVRRAFDGIAERLSDGRPFLFGDRFTAADLTFACLAAPVICPPRYGVTLPQPDQLPRALADTIRGFREHPAGAFALRMYEEERGVRVPA